MFENRFHFELTRRRISWTKPRNQVYLALYHHGPCTISALVGILSEQVSQRTVYNTINLLVRLDIATRVQITGSSTIDLAYPYKQHHHYFVCSQCTKKIRFNDERIEAAIAKFDRRRLLKLTGHHLQLTGLCASCAQKSLTPPPDYPTLNIKRMLKSPN